MLNEMYVSFQVHMLVAAQGTYNNYYTMMRWQYENLANLTFS